MFCENPCLSLLSAAPLPIGLKLVYPFLRRMSTTPTPLTVTANEARLQFSDLINRAIYTKQPTIITRQRKPAVVLVNYEDWLALQPSVGVTPVENTQPHQIHPEGEGLVEIQYGEGLASDLTN